ncbi:MAG: TonB-dependent receptor [Acidobacteria bacterium]|nr:TonB-dependent receptor [Acidobacteriota bacterium]
MAGTPSVLASAAVGTLLVAGTTTGAAAQTRPPVAPIVRPVASAAPGALSGVVRDERGQPVEHAVVSALGASTTVAVTDASGRFEFGALTPGPYLVRAHLAGYVAPRAQMVEVRSSARATSAIAVRREGAAPILAAGFGVPSDLGSVPTTSTAESTSASGQPPESAASNPPTDTENHTETAWRIRHGRRGILKDATLPEDLAAADDDREPASIFAQLAGTSGRVASLFTEAPLSGQVNILASGVFDAPQQLFSNTTVARNTTNVRVGAPAGDNADWTVAGALSQADISSWVVAGAYTMRAPARHRYDIGMSYSTQRYGGGNPLALRDVTDGSRNVGTVYAYDSLTLAPAATVAFGAEYARYDYLASRSLLSPRVEMTLSPAARTRITAAVSQRALAPGAEEFLAPPDGGIWLPPQRTFSPVDSRQGFKAQRTLAASAGLERDFGVSTLAVRGFSERAADQLVTVFGAELPGEPTAKVGHYLVGNAGQMDVRGVSAEFRAVIASRVHGSLRYSVARGQLLRSGDDTLMLLAPAAAAGGTAAIQDVTARIDADVPETATRVMVLYRLSNGFIPPAGAAASSPGLDGRFDVQVRQSLPFLNFTSARWEMLLAVRNFFRDATAEQAFVDELFVLRPPKRVVGGVTLHF